MRRKFPHLMRNILAIALLECCWSVGVWMVNPFTVIPNFLLRFGAAPAVIGLLPALWGVGNAFGALVAGSIVAGRRKIAVTLGIWHYISILPYLGLGLLALATGWTAVPGWAGQLLTLALICAFNFVMGPLFQLYFVLLTRLLPEQDRGRLFGAVFSVATLIGLLGPLIAGDLLAGVGVPTRAYAPIFLGAFALFCLGQVGFFFMRERPTPPQPLRRIRDNLSAILRNWRGNPRLRRYLVARIWTDGALLTSAFLATYSRTEGGLSEDTVTRLGMVLVCGQAAGSLFLGWYSGRQGGGLDGYLRAQVLTRTAMVSALLFAALGPAVPAAVVLAVSAGLLSSSDIVINPNVFMEMGPRHARTDMMTLGTLVLTPSLMLIPPLAGFGIGLLGHRPVFIFAAVCALNGLALLSRLRKDPVTEPV